MTTNEYNSCVENFADGIFRFVLKLSHNEADAKDTVQNVFEKLWKKHAQVQFETAKSYLFTSAYRDWIDQTRKIKRMYFSDQLPENGTDEVATQEFENREWIEKAFVHLPEIQKSVILLRDYEGYSYEEIADITGLNLSQVKVYIFRGRKKMQSALQQTQISKITTQM
ncbi:MAG: RNA polymerase sigma factor [Bacteroidia bacterium]|nr:RNA polymerase sigma factor [Bacteroidia bacterium]